RPGRPGRQLACDDRDRSVAAPPWIVSTRERSLGPDRQRCPLFAAPAVLRIAPRRDIEELARKSSLGPGFPGPGRGSRRWCRNSRRCRRGSRPRSNPTPCELIQYKPSVNFRAHPAFSSSRGSPAPRKSAPSRILRWHSAAHRAASALRRQRASREARSAPATPLLTGKLGAIESPGDVGRDRPSVNSRSGSVASSCGGKGLGCGSQASSSSMKCAGPDNGCWKPMSGSILGEETLGEETSVAARICSTYVLVMLVL